MIGNSRCCLRALTPVVQMSSQVSLKARLSVGLTPISRLHQLINDMPDSLRSSDARSFADDSLLYHTVIGNRDITLLQEDLTEEWGRIWRQLRFNPPKCTIMRITNRRRKNVYHFSNNLGG